MLSSIINLAVVGSCALPVLCQAAHYYEDTATNACYGYINGNNAAVTSGKAPEPRACKSMNKWKDDYYYNFYSKDYSPAPYRDSSCCSNTGASDLSSGRNQQVSMLG